MSLKKKLKNTSRKIGKVGRKTVETVAMVALTPVAIAVAVKKARDD